MVRLRLATLAAATGVLLVVGCCDPCSFPLMSRLTGRCPCMTRGEVMDGGMPVCDGPMLEDRGPCTLNGAMPNGYANGCGPGVYPPNGSLPGPNGSLPGTLPYPDVSAPAPPRLVPTPQAQPFPANPGG